MPHGGPSPQPQVSAPPQTNGPVPGPVPPTTVQPPTSSPVTPVVPPPGTQPGQPGVTTVARTAQPGPPQQTQAQKQNRLTPIEKPTGLDPVVLLAEKENRLVLLLVPFADFICNASKS